MKKEIVCITPGTIKIKGRTFIRHSVDVKLLNGKVIKMQRGDSIILDEKTVEEFQKVNNGFAALNVHFIIKEK